MRRGGPPWIERLLRRWLATGRTAAITTISLALVGVWGANWALGGADRIPPHGFYFPIVFAAVRFGWVAAASTASIAGVLAGPLLPADRLTGDAQVLTDWVVRWGFFVAIGVAFALLARSLVDDHRDALLRLDDERELATAIAEDQLRVVYQPLVRAGGSIVGVEALVRWQHPRFGLLTPDSFIPLAESSGLITELDDWVMRTACREVASWRPHVLADLDRFEISVNVSVEDLNSGDLPMRVTRAVEAADVPASWLQLEITETALAVDLDRSIRQLEDLERTGVRLAIDDFGTGYGSLTYLDRFPVDVVKIDRSFVAGITREGVTRSVAGAIVTLAHQLDLHVVAEGVETDTQAAALEQLGCSRFQGWLFGPAVPPDRIVGGLEAQAAASAAADEAASAAD